MKKSLLSLKKCALQVVLLCSMLFGLSSNVFGFTVYFDNTNTNWSNVYVYFYSGKYWEGNGSGSQSSKNCKVGPVQMTQGDNNIYSYEFSGSYNIVAFTKDSQSNYGNFWQTEAAYSDGENFNVEGQYSSSTPLFVAGTDKETKNQNVPYYSGEWSTYPPTPPAPPTCSDFSIPSEVLSGDNIMFYIEGHHDGNNTTGITNGTSKDCLGTSVKIDKKKSYINIAKTSIPDNIKMSNNCGGWEGDGSTPKSDIKAGKYHTYNNSGTVDATTLVTFSASETTIAVGTEKVNLTIKGSSQYSSFKGSNYKLYCLVLLDGNCAGVTEVQTTDQVFELNTSSLATGVHTVQSVLTDKKIYYLDASLDITVGSTASYTIEAKATAGGSIEGTSKYTDQPEGATQSFTASEPQTGYQFDGWTATNEAVISAPEELTTNITIGAFSTVATANYLEILSTISVSASEGGSVDQSSVNVGVATSAQITATPNSGYKFKEWTLTNATLVSGSLTDATISIKANGTGEAGTAVASFEFNPSTGWYLRGSFSDKGWSSDGQIEFLATQGQTSGVIGTATLQYDKTDDFKVKVFTLENGTTEKWCGRDNTTISETTSDVHVHYGSGNDINIKPSVIGDYRFTLKKSGDNYYMDVTYPEIIETKSIITVSVASECASMGTVSPSGDIEVGDKIATQISAMPIGSYKLSTWVLGGSAVLASGSLTDATISIKADGSGEAGTAVATFEEDPDAKTLYFVNSVKWATPYIHMWSPDYHGWPGSPMVKTTETATSEEYEVWAFTFNGPQTNCKFNCGSSDCQTDNYEIDYTHPYFYQANKTWYATLDDIPEPEYITLVYVNKAGWSNVNIQMKGGSSSMNWPGVAMTKSDDKKFGVDVYTYTFMKGQYTNYIINKGDGGGQIEKNIEEGKYVHYNGVRYATLDAIPLPSLAGDFNEWSADANIFELNEEGVGSTTITLEANAKPEFMVIDGQMLGNTGTMTYDNCTNWTMSYQDGGGNNCKIQARNKGEFTFTYDVKTSKLSVTYPEMVTGFSLIINDTEIIDLAKNELVTDYNEYYVHDVEFATGDVLTFLNKYDDGKFVVPNLDRSDDLESAVSGHSTGIKVDWQGRYDVYLKMYAGYDNNWVYMEGLPILDDVSAPEEYYGNRTGKNGSYIVKRVLDTQSYNTLCLPFSLSAAQIAETPLAGSSILKYVDAVISGSGTSMEATLRFADVSEIEAGKPYLILPAEDILEPMEINDVTISVSEGSTEGDGKVEAVGILKPTHLSGGDPNNLFLGLNNTFYWPAAGDTSSLKGMRAYFHVLLSQMIQFKAPAKLQIMAPLPTGDNVPDGESTNGTYKTFNEQNIVIIVQPDGTINTLDGKEVK